MRSNAMQLRLQKVRPILWCWGGNLGAKSSFAVIAEHRCAQSASSLLRYGPTEEKTPARPGI
jgi:hypothetical protein